MHRSMLSLAFVAALPFAAHAAEEELYGTYALVSTSQKLVETGQVDTYTNERGFITYTREGRMFVVIARGERPKPESLAKMTDAQRVGLFRTLTAYTGTYKFDGKAIEHDIDVSWNEVWTGTAQIRHFSRDGDTITLATDPGPRPTDGKLAVTTLVWRKVK